MGLLNLLYIAVFVIEVHAQTDPTSIVCTALNSTALRLSWTSASDTSVLGYYVDVERVDGLRIEPAIPTADLSSRIYATHDTYGLGKYGTYNITLFSYTSSTNLTQYVTTCTTSEDVPDSASRNFACTSYSTSAIQCSWNALAQVYWNGILQGYRLQWLTTANISELYSTTVDSNTTSTLLSGLSYGTMYTLLLNPYTIVGDGTVYATTMAATKGLSEPVEENVTRYYCNEAFPGMIEFGWEEMPCTIYTGTIGALTIICALFVSIFACQACCKSKPEANNVSVNVFNPDNRGRQFKDDDSETDEDYDDDIPHIDEKRQLDDDEYNNSEPDEEGTENKGYSSDLEHEYDDRYTATPGADRNTVTPSDDRKTVKTADGRNTATPVLAMNPQCQQQVNKMKPTATEVVTDGVRHKHLHRKRIATARDVELRDSNAEDNENQDVFSDSDYDSQSDNDSSNEADFPKKPGVSSKVPVVAVTKQTTAHSKQQNSTQHERKTPAAKANQITKRKDAIGSKSTEKKENDMKKEKVVRTTVTKGNEHKYDENVAQNSTSNSFDLDNGTTLNDASTGNIPITNSALNNGENLDELGWGSPTLGEGVKQTYNSSKMSQNDFNVTVSEQNNHASNTSWDDDDGWGGALTKTSQYQLANSQTMLQTDKTGQTHIEMKKTEASPVFKSKNDSENTIPSGWDTPSATTKLSMVNRRSSANNNSKEPSGSQDIKKKVRSGVLKTMKANENSILSGWNTPSTPNKLIRANKTTSDTHNFTESPDIDDWDIPDETKSVMPANKSFFGKQNATSNAPTNNPKLKVYHQFENRTNKTFNMINENTDDQSKQSSNDISDAWADNNTEPITLDRSAKVNPHDGRLSTAKSNFNQSKGDHKTASTPNLKTAPFIIAETGNKNDSSKGHNGMGVGKNKETVRGLKNSDIKQTISPVQKKHGKISFHVQQKQKISSMEYKNMFYIEDEVEYVQNHLDAKDLPNLKRPTSEKNGKMIQTNAWQPQHRKQSIKSGRKTPVTSIPKSQSWTTLEAEPVIGTDRLGKKFPFLNVDAGANVTTKAVKKVSSESDVQTYNSSLPDLRRSSEPAKSDKMKDAVNAFSDPSNKSNKSSMSYGFGIHGRFRQIAAAWVARFRAKKNPVRTVNSEWF